MTTFLLPSSLFIAFIIHCLIVYSCKTDDLGQEKLRWPSKKETDALTDSCSNATRYAVKLCIDENKKTQWEGLWDECFNLGVQTNWNPGIGEIQLISKWQLCQDGFQWQTVNFYCPVPDHNWEVNFDGTYWVGSISFTPNECLAEGIPNCYEFNIHGVGCPF